MGDTIRVRGEGGAEFTLSLPLNENLEAQLAKGTIVVVDDPEPDEGDSKLDEGAKRSSGK